MANTRQLLKNVEQLERALHPGFALWCGMAVSAAPKKEGQGPAFPTGLQFIDAILGAAKTSLQKPGSPNADVFTLAAQYAGRMRSDGPLRRLTDLARFRKFEDLIGRMEQAIGPATLDALMKAAFLGSPEDANANHQALAFLIHEGHVPICFTSNFDNGIENTAPLRVFVHPPTDTNPLVDAQLYKLHGDAKLGRYVTTLGEMVAAEDQHRHEYLRDLLNGKTVLVLGYSGTGDIDLFPYLSSGGAQLVWAVHGSRAPACASAVIETDLFSFDDDNVLLSLAQRRGWKGPAATGQERNWRKAIAEVIGKLSPGVLVNIVAQLMFQHGGVEYVRLCRAAGEAQPPLPLLSQMRGGRPYIEVSAYQSVLAGMEQEENLMRKHYWRGFALWRLYRHKEAAREFHAALDAIAASEQDWEVNALVIHRVYLENLRDMLRQRLFGRKALWKRYLGQTSYTYLEDRLAQPYDTDLHGRDEERRLLSRIVLLEIDLLFRRPVKRRKVYELVARCESLVHNNPAFPATGCLLSLGPRGFYQGFPPWKRLMKIYWSTRNWTYIVKGLASLIYAAAPRILRPLLCRINNQLIGRTKVLVQERRVRAALEMTDNL